MRRRAPYVGAVIIMPAESLALRPDGAFTYYN
jgi:hypothetical protein